MNITTIKGLKYPDEYFIKFFFKYQFHQQQQLNLTFLELGSSNGCNLMLPFQHHCNVIGVELDSKLVEFAKDNFKSLKQSFGYEFYAQDMRDYCQQMPLTQAKVPADVLILANSIYYIPEQDFILLLRNIKRNNLIKKNIPFFIRFRDTDDYRNGKGEEVNQNGIIMQNKVTGEDGLFGQFYEKQKMIEILSKELNLRDYQVLSIQYENIQNNTKVNNSDIVIWGQIN